MTGTCPTCQKQGKLLIDIVTWRWEVAATKEVVTFKMTSDKALCGECIGNVANCFFENVERKKLPTAK